MSHGQLRALVLGTLAAALAAACAGPAVPNPLGTGPRYLCCNLHFEKPRINDVNYQRGTMIPFGTPVDVTSATRRSATFQATGFPPIEVQLRYGRKVLTMEQYMDRLFVTTDPRTRLRKPTGGKKSKDRGEVERINKAIERGEVLPGMTRDEVLMAIGYPPAHRTPSLDSSVWTYWDNSFATFEVRFDGDRVAQVQR